MKKLEEMWENLASVWRVWRELATLTDDGGGLDRDGRESERRLRSRRVKEHSAYRVTSEKA